MSFLYSSTGRFNELHQGAKTAIPSAKEINLWIRGSLSDDLKALSEKAAAAYIERAQLVFQLLTMEPLLSANETAAFWAAGAVVMEQAQRLDAGSSEESNKILHETTRGFFDSFCQQFMENIADSDMKLSLDSEEIKALIAPTFDEMDPDRVEKCSHLFGALSTNALNLSGATLAILYQGLKEKEASAALKHARSVVRSCSGLNKFERERAEESLSTVNWKTSS